MPTSFSDSIEYKHPLPPSYRERKLSGGIWMDWANEAEINAVVPLAYRKNKYFWIAGSLMQCDNDGTTYRPTAGGGNTAWKILKLAVNADGSGTPDETFDGFVAAGYSVSHPLLENLKLGTILINGIGFQDFYSAASNNYVQYTSISGSGSLTLSNDNGPFTAPGTIILAYQNI